MKDYTKTKVIFRKFKGGDVIAMFPEIPGSNGRECMSYMHTGQHGSADPALVYDDTVKPSPKETSALRDELRAVGYDIEVRYKFTQKDRAMRLYTMRRSLP